jgi:hypothetical protein
VGAVLSGDFPRFIAALLGALTLAGCTGLLPKSTNITKSPWASYREAQLNFDKIVPGKTTHAELRDLQLDPQANPNIAILNYSDILMRFLPNASISLTDLDTGVRECIAAKTICRGYTVTQKLVHRNREGNFIADLLGFRRETVITGWSFNGLILVKDDVVVYKLTGGQPQILEHEHVSSPLGPFMGLGARLFSF